MTDDRIGSGMQEMLAARSRALGQGQRAIGWKVGFGTDAAMSKLGTEEPLVGFLLASAVLEDGSNCDISSWSNPVLEPEVAVYVGTDVAGEVTEDQASDAISGLGAAIELVDLDSEESDPARILAANSFQRHVIFGPMETGRADSGGITASVLRNGEVADSTDDVAALTGTPAEAIKRVASILSRSGESLRSGDVIISGSIVPGMQVEPGDEVTVQLPPLGKLEVRF
jgi:2-keto-4-pentenoate hydratase